MDSMRFHRRHPYLFVGVLEATIVGAFVVAGALTRRLGLSAEALYGIGFVILTVTSLVLLARMRWWKEVGFRPLREYGLLWLPALPLIGTLFQFFSGGAQVVGGTLLLSMLVLTALNGFAEEVFYRGLMLRALVPKGTWQALVVTSLIFAFTHSMNILTGWSTERVLWQLSYSFAFGFGWAAFALGTRTIWPLILIHFLNNFFSLAGAGSLVQTGEVSTISRAIMVFYTAAFIVYGVVVTRSHGKAQDAHAAGASQEARAPE
jgi:membrane protease YdiL (CAAX protease family)